MKFGGSSVVDAERIRAVTKIVADRRERRPLVVVSALGGVTDLLEASVRHAASGRREALEPVLADLERRHRWAVAGTLDDPGRRHDLSLELDRGFEDLRQRLRSIRVLGEATPRAVDGVLSRGELWSAAIVAACFADRGLPSIWLDPRLIIQTDDGHGRAVADPAAVASACAAHVEPLLHGGSIPVTGGFVGRGRSGDTTTLGRGGSDTTASVLGMALDAEEIQIWTDVDGLMSADPRRVPTARTLPRVSFAEAAELAFCGARVLHPASIAPAVAREIPVRVLNSLRPEGAGTLVVSDSLRTPLGAEAPAALVSRGGIELVRVTSRRLRVGERPAPAVEAALGRLGLIPLLVVATETSIGLALAEPGGGRRLAETLAESFEVGVDAQRALVAIVGAGLAVDPGLRRRVLDQLVRVGPDLIAVGASHASVSAIVPEGSLDDSLREMHRQFFERTPCG